MNRSTTEEKEADDASNIKDEKNNDLALKDLNITIRAGEKVAICGRSGRYAPGSPKFALYLLSIG